MSTLRRTRNIDGFLTTSSVNSPMLIVSSRLRVSNSNSTIAQKLAYTIPIKATKETGSLIELTDLASIGMTLKGLAIFNNASSRSNTATCAKLAESVLKAMR